MGQEKETGKSPISYTSMHYDVISFSQVGYFTILKEKTEDLPTFVIVVTSVTSTLACNISKPLVCIFRYIKNLFPFTQF